MSLICVLTCGCSPGSEMQNRSNVSDSANIQTVIQYSQK